MTDLITYSLEGRVATITMDDGKANAMGHALMDAVLEALDRAEKEAKVLVLKGRPGIFSAGFDLKVMTGPPEGIIDLLYKGSVYLNRLFVYPLPLIIVNTGQARAGGALTLLTGDHRIVMDGEFQIGLNETLIGMPLPTLGLEMARDRLSPQELTRATICATLYSPAEAVKAGYADEVVAPEEIDAAVERAAQKLLKVDSRAYAFTKKRLRQVAVDRMNINMLAEFHNER